MLIKAICHRCFNNSSRILLRSEFRIDGYFIVRNLLHYIFSALFSSFKNDTTVKKGWPPKVATKVFINLWRPETI